MDEAVIIFRRGFPFIPSVTLTKSSKLNLVKLETLFYHSIDSNRHTRTHECFVVTKEYLQSVLKGIRRKGIFFLSIFKLLILQENYYLEGKLTK